MEKKSQVYLSALVMYVIAGFSGAIYKLTSNYWTILVLSVMVIAFTIVSIVGKDNTTLRETKVEWISAVSLFGLEVLFTILIEVAKTPFSSFMYLFYAMQIAGFILIGYSVVRLTLKSTTVLNDAMESFKNRKTNKDVKMESSNDEVASKVEEAIASESEEDTTDVEVVGESENKEPEVLGIEMKEEKTEIETPYMEEEV